MKQLTLEEVHDDELICSVDLLTTGKTEEKNAGFAPADTLWDWSQTGPTFPEAELAVSKPVGKLQALLMILVQVIYISKELSVSEYRYNLKICGSYLCWKVQWLNVKYRRKCWAAGRSLRKNNIFETLLYWHN